MIPLMKRLPVKVIPFFEIEIDYGEKNRIHVEELLRGRLRVLAFRLLPAFNLKRIPDFVFPDDHFLEYFFEFIYVFFVGG